MKHVLETKIRKADRLSRRLDWKVGVEKDNDNQVFIKDCWLHNLYKVVIDGPEVEIVEKARNKDKEIIKVIKEIKKINIKVLREDE